MCWPSACLSRPIKLSVSVQWLNVRCRQSINLSCPIKLSVSEQWLNVLAVSLFVSSYQAISFRAVAKCAGRQPVCLVLSSYQFVAAKLRCRQSINLSCPIKLSVSVQWLNVLAVSLFVSFYQAISFSAVAKCAGRQPVCLVLSSYQFQCSG